MPWPPKVGEPLPRAADAWYERRKLEWILSDKGHGPEWQKVFRVTACDSEVIWKAIADATLGSTVEVVRDRFPFGVTCGIRIDLEITGRRAPTTIGWQYAVEASAPRLVTAYPTP